MQWLINTLIWLPAIIIGLTFHEYAHGRVAYWLGDDTPYYQGRLTLNPLPHIDWVGFFMLLFFKFGWAKPVEVNPYNFRNSGVKQGMMLVSLAGPAMNLMLALTGMLILKFYGIDPGAGFSLYTNSTVLLLVGPLVYINLILAVFNLIPLPPLDGSKILAGLLPDSGAQFMYSIEQYGPLILLLFIITGAFGKILNPLVNIMYSLLYTAVF
ncbi:site-2 protease family protein [Syntrophomonas palmitatica]|uniref:site-2 protease family protein n=1 Tax=Syntrophomonas palmitatica TaxID=402877 RepID=UPI0006D2935B|nr:site-2 protease family protein [Syntrophomonas palmitatica]